MKFSKFDLEVELTEPSTWLKQSGTGVSGYYKTSIISIFCCIEKHNIESSKSYINVASIKGEEIPSLKPIRMVPLEDLLKINMISTIYWKSTYQIQKLRENSSKNGGERWGGGWWLTMPTKTLRILLTKIRQIRNSSIEKYAGKPFD